MEKSDDDSSVSNGAKGSKGLIVDSKSFKDGLIYLYKRSDFVKPTWMCRVKIPNGKGYLTRSTRTGDEHQAFKFADDLYNQLLIKSLTGGSTVTKQIGPAIAAYIKRLEPDRSRQSVHYKILLMERIKPTLARKTFDELPVIKKKRPGREG